jgi:hypothetical protein
VFDRHDAVVDECDGVVDGLERRLHEFRVHLAGADDVGGADHHDGFQGDFRVHPDHGGSVHDTWTT